MLKQSVNSTIVQTAGKAVSILITLVTVRLVVKHLGTTGYGNFILITSIFLLFDAVADLGTRMIGAREAAKTENESEKKPYFKPNI